MLLIPRKKEPYKWPEERVGKCRHRQQYFDPYAADSSGRGNASYVSVEFISAAIFSAGV